MLRLFVYHVDMLPEALHGIFVDGAFGQFLYFFVFPFNHIFFRLCSLLPSCIFLQSFIFFKMLPSSTRKTLV